MPGDYSLADVLGMCASGRILPVLTTSARVVKASAAYVVAVVAYIVLGLFTKRFLTWTWGPIFFVVALEVFPRLIGRLRHALPGSRSATPSEAIVES